MPAEATTARGPETPREWFTVARFAALHLLCLAAIWTGVPWQALALCIGLWAFRKFAITAGYHRYFAHRTYEMGRVMQFVMAFLAQTSMQKGVLWWAANHRHHHKHSDDPEDVHSPNQENLFWAHVGWLLISDFDETDISRVRDLAQYPELRLLNRHPYTPGLLMALGCWLWMGWAGLVVGFLWSTVLLWHTTFTINSLAHVFGSRRYETEDDSRNNWFLALLTFGEGWHNNHHHYQASTRQGFYWWEVDITYYLLWLMSKIGLVHNLSEPPEHVVRDRPSPARAARRARDRLEDRVHQLRARVREGRAWIEESTEGLDERAADRFRDLSRRVERQLDELCESVDQVGRGAHDKLTARARKALEDVERLSERVDTGLAELDEAEETDGATDVVPLDIPPPNNPISNTR